MADGSIRFTPDENFNGEASFDYTVSDGELTDTAGQRAGGDAYRRAIGGNIELASRLFEILEQEAELERATLGLSIATFRFVPADLDPSATGVADYLNDLNAALLTEVQRGGEAFLSNAVVRGRFLLRACITNFRSGEADIAALPGIVRRLGHACDRELRRKALKPLPS